ncbi:AEC family transporter [Acidaminococcus sp.]|uniref:AEC family transporter n=1 Tax=Acidaminococcus sp. TaxID=1872103 RepID=UPI003D7C864D
MDILRLANLQITLFLLILAGLLLKKKGILDKEGKRCLTDLCVNVVIPCNILKSCLAPLGNDVLNTCGRILLAAFFMQAVYLVLNRFLFNRYTEGRKKVLQYCTIASNGGFLGNPVAEGVYGPLGLLYASVFLIPMRIIMWSVGTSYFVAKKVDGKAALKKVLTHPCLVAIYIGMICMVFQLHLPRFLEMTVTYIGNCNSALTMFIVGTILADVPLSTIVNRDSVLYSVFRLGLLPLIALVLCHMLGGLDNVGTGVSVVMTGMPAPATAAIFAAQYDSDFPFATQLVILSTLLSMFTIPVWCYFIG